MPPRFGPPHLRLRATSSRGHICHGRTHQLLVAVAVHVAHRVVLLLQSRQRRPRRPGGARRLLGGQGPLLGHLRNVLVRPDGVHGRLLEHAGLDVHLGPRRQRRLHWHVLRLRGRRQGRRRRRRHARLPAVRLFGLVLRAELEYDRAGRGLYARVPRRQHYPGRDAVVHELPQRVVLHGQEWPGFNSRWRRRYMWRQPQLRVFRVVHCRRVGARLLGGFRRLQLRAPGPHRDCGLPIRVHARRRKSCCVRLQRPILRAAPGTAPP